MRVSYSDEEDFVGQFDLYAANCERSLRGRKGQVALRELEAALQALPHPQLGHDVLVEPTGEVCAIGAMMVQRRIDAGMSREQAIAECSNVDSCDTQEAGERIGMPSLVAWSAAVENDEYRRETPEQRYERMLAWVRGCLA